MSGILNLLLAGAASVIKDAYFNLVTLLLNTTATNGAQNNTFLDSANQAVFTASITTTVMTVTAITSGSISVGTGITGTGVTGGTTVVNQLTGTTGSTGTYTVSASQTVSSTTITATGFPITRNGNTTQGTFTPFSQTGWGAYNVGTASYCQLNNSDYSISTGDFTIEFWMFVTSDKAATCFCSATSNPNLTVAMNSGSAGARLPYLEYAGATTFATAFSNYLNTWTHVAFVRSSGTVTVYQNGVAITSASKSGAVGTTANLYLMRNSGDAGQDFPGYISNFRICKAAVYTGNFTPTTTNFTTTSQGATSCQLLTFQSNRFVDNSSNAATVTPTLTQVQAFSPFAPTIEYDTAVVGGSGYFDGTGDYLTVGSGTDVDLGTSDFMIEAWYYCLANGTYCSGVVSKRVGGVASGWGMTTSGFVCDMAGTWYDSWSNPFWVGSTQNSGFNSGTSLQKLNQWTHIVVTRQGTDARWFVNGQLLGYFSRTGAIQQLTGSPLAVGLNGTTAEQPFNGYISNCRVVVGSVPTGYQTSSTTLNTQIFTPPTAPVSTTSQGATSGNVKYIGNFSNSGIFDSTAKNVLETVDNAQVSTTQAKWGTTSMYFDGTGDYLVSPNTKMFTLNGAFTIEAWVYRNTSSKIILIEARTGGGYADYLLAILTNGTVEFVTATSGNYYNPSIVTTSGQWVHVALVRNSSNVVTWYVDGVAASTTVTISGVLAPAASAVWIGAQRDPQYSSGYIDDMRITQYARYTANFTPPAAAFPLQ
jgi:hypothetical protein